MTTVYLDSCVFQDLKEEKNKELLKKILAAKSHVLFVFSEAHLYDLDQDKTDHKYADTDFIETIAGPNCYYFTDRTEFDYRTPREYYDDFEWPQGNLIDEAFNGQVEGLTKLFNDY